MTESSTTTSSTPSEDDFVVEYLSESGKRRRLVGFGDDWDAAYECYEAARRENPYLALRLRHGKKTVAFYPPRRVPMKAGHA